MRPRIEKELALLRESFLGAEHREHGGNDWFLLPSYRFPTGWRDGTEAITTAPVAFMINSGFPGQPPYAFHMKAGITFQGWAPNNCAGVPDGQNPFPGAWMQFSWAPDFPWGATDDPRAGSNLVHWARSFAARLKEGI